MTNLDHAFLMSEHKGACNAIIAAGRLLRLSGQWDASELIIKHLDMLVPQVPVLEPLPPETKVTI